MPAPDADGRPAPGHLIHIGYAKAGSTFLQHWFAGHPELAYVGGGIAGYTDVLHLARESVLPPRRIAYRVTSAEDLSCPLAHAGVAGHRGGDWHPTRAARAAVCAELAALFPNACILLVTRGFGSAYVSGYSQYVRMGGNRDFDPTGRNPPAGTLDDEWQYDELIEQYEAAFAGHVVVVPFELLRDDPHRFVSVLQAELGLSEPGPIPGRVNPSLAPAELRWYPRLTRLVESLPFRGRLRHRALDAWVRQTNANRLAGLIGILDRVRPGPPIDPAQLSDELIGSLRGRAQTLRDRPLYAAYAADYLL